MQKLFDASDSAKIKRYSAIALAIAVFSIIGLALLINVTAKDDNESKSDAEQIINILESN